MERQREEEEGRNEGRSNSATGQININREERETSKPTS
jgi:hypothetical protein